MKRIRYEQDYLRSIVENFHIYGEFVQAELMGQGHINHTFILTMDQGGNHVRYILQCINENVFLQPIELLDNYVRITEHLYQKYKKIAAVDISRRCIRPICTWHNNSQPLQPYFIDGAGRFWRCYLMIERVLSLDKVIHIEHVRAAAIAFGRFQKYLLDLPREPELYQTIPRFHDIRLRYQQFENAITSNVAGRLREIHSDIEFYQARKDTYCILEEMREQGILPTRLCHNDTKISNILLDEHTGEGLAVIDLDTVMPGTILYDFGDLGRTSLSNSTEDEIDTDKIGVRIEYFGAMVEGFLQEWGNDLSKTEVRLLTFAPRVMTLIIGLRFLTDYLNGDIYFKTNSVKQNLERARTHIALVKSMEKSEEEMKQTLSDINKKLGLQYHI